MSIAVGIDLGTTNSGVAVLRNEEPEILMLGDDPFIPSCVAFDKTKVLVGKEAKHIKETHENKKNVISGIKYIIGLDYNSAKNEAERQDLSFDLEEVDGTPQIKVDYNGGTESFSPEEISAMILSELKTIATKSLDCKNIKAVITVPTLFTSKRRAATKLAAEIAGIDVLQVVNESTAAAIAYEKLKRDRLGRRRRILVFDLGGGTLDITIIKTKGKRITVRASGGNLELGGENFTRNLIDDTKNALKSKSAIKEFTSYITNAEANRVKESLSYKYEESFKNKVNGDDISVTRARLTKVNKDKYRAAISLVTDVMFHAGITKDKIQHVVLSGGSVKIPFFSEELGKMFGRKKIYCHTEPDQFVVKGAAILASYFSGDNKRDGNDYLTAINGLDFSDVTPFSLGFCDSKGTTIFVIPKNTKFPVCRTKSWGAGKAQNILFQICEGENNKFVDNELLYSTDIPISPTRNGKVTLTVTFNLENSRSLYVVVKQKDSANAAKITIDFEKHISDEAKLNVQQRRLEKIILQTKMQRTLEKKSAKDQKKQSPVHEHGGAPYNQQPEIEPEYAQAVDVAAREHGALIHRPQESSTDEFEQDDDDHDDDENIRTCVALYDYEARTEEEMSIRQGEKFTVIKKHDGYEWTKVSSKHNEIGNVPTNYLQFD